MIRLICDKCTSDIYDPYNEKTTASCMECDNDKHYHPTCLILYNSNGHSDDRMLCQKHYDEIADSLKSEQIINEYIAKLCKDVGLAGSNYTTNNGNSTFDLKLCDLRLTIRARLIFDESKTMTGIKYSIDGLSSKTKVVTASVHDHDAAVKQIRKSLLASLRSTKSAATQGYNESVTRLACAKENWEQKIEKIQNIITVLKKKEKGKGQ